MGISFFPSKGSTQKNNNNKNEAFEHGQGLWGKSCRSSSTHVPILAPEDRRLDIAVPEHPPPHPRQRDPLPEEDAPDPGRDVGKGIAHAADDDILEGGGLLDEGGLSLPREEVALVDKLFGELEDCIFVLVQRVVINYPSGRGFYWI